MVVDDADSCSSKRRTAVLLPLAVHKTCRQDYCFERDYLLDETVEVMAMMGCGGGTQTHSAVAVDVLDYLSSPADAEMPEVDP